MIFDKDAEEQGPLLKRWGVKTDQI